MNSNIVKNIWLIPVPLSEDGEAHIPRMVSGLIGELRFFIVERARTARRWMKKLHPEINFETIEIYELNKHGDNEGLKNFMSRAFKEGDIGLMSEAGCPGVADPGAEVVALGHHMGANVKPLSGPSSILLALMASGFSGQQFTFNGYLPPKRPELKQMLKKLEQQAISSQMTQIFIETPYRNMQVLETSLETLQPATHLCIAMNITGGEEWIYSGTIETWKKKNVPSLHKNPCIFLIARSASNQKL